MPDFSNFRFLVLAALLPALGCVSHKPAAATVINGSALLQAEHLLDDDSTIALVIRAKTGRLWSLRHTLARPHLIVLRESGAGRVVASLDSEVAQPLRAFVAQEIANLERSSKPEAWTLRTMRELYKRLTNRLR